MHHVIADFVQFLVLVLFNLLGLLMHLSFVIVVNLVADYLLELLSVILGTKEDVLVFTYIAIAHGPVEIRIITWLEVNHLLQLSLFGVYETMNSNLVCVD